MAYQRRFDRKKVVLVERTNLRSGSGSNFGAGRTMAFGKIQKEAQRKTNR